MYELLKKVYPLRLAPVSNDSDKAVEILCKELDFTVHEYPSGKECNGWTVPQKWEAEKAIIKKNGKVIYDAMAHPLGVAGYSTPFKGEVSLSELKKHLFYHPELPHALVYHCDYFYKQWKRDWGLCVSRNLFDSLQDGMYFVDIETKFEPGTMKVLDFLLAGDRKDTIILNAHNCHAAQANDDISGVVVAIEVIKRLKKRKERRFSYRVIIAPEHLGTVFYLDSLKDKVTRGFKYAMFLEMLGTKDAFALQESFTGNSRIDLAAHHYLEHNFPGHRSDKFRKIVGNDETVWESAGYEIPCISISRGLYQEYHSNFDNEDIILPEKLEESVNLVLGIIDILETEVAMKRNFKGLVALSNPKYDLYFSTFDPSIRRDITDEQRKWNRLMDFLPRYFDAKTSSLDISIKHGLEHKKVLDYINKFKEKKLVDFKVV